MIEVPLTQGKVALIDDEDCPLVLPFKWCASSPRASLWYAVRGIQNGSGIWTTVRMHVVIMGTKNIDHINLNGLDNQRNNLRVATGTQNNANRPLQRNNSSGYKGVSYHKPTQKWSAYIKYRYVKRHIGYFATPEEAALAYDKAAIECFGEFAKLNLLEKDDPIGVGAADD